MANERSVERKGTMGDCFHSLSEKAKVKEKKPRDKSENAKKKWMEREGNNEIMEITREEGKIAEMKSIHHVFLTINPRFRQRFLCLSLSLSLPL